MAGLGTKIQEETWKHHGLQSSSLCMEAFHHCSLHTEDSLWNNHPCTLRAKDSL